MPITVRTAQPVQLVGTTSIDISAIAVGDFMILSAITVGATVPAPTSEGWIEIFGGQYSGTVGSGTLRYRAWWKFKQAGENSVLVPNINALSSGGRFFLHSAGGVNPTSPFDVTPDTALHLTNGGNGSSFNPAAITPVTAGSLYVVTVFDWSSSGASNLSISSPVTQLPMLTHQWSALTTRSYSRTGSRLWSSGAMDATLTGGFKETWLASVMVLREAISGNGGVKIWNGTAWVAKPVKFWNGTAWVTKPAKFWNGTAWVTPPY